ncbi:MAG: DUF3795 domain-containing protein [Elusimicrobia bacterium]|nr:DUF3795 domain-containing protein [Elusimicrobiota bacterium]
MNNELSVCGCECPECEHFKKLKCSGCSEIKGKVWWVSYINAEVCPIYSCVSDKKKYNNCGECAEIPCKLWKDLKDPSYTQKQHDAGVKTRVENLKRLKEK